MTAKRIIVWYRNDLRIHDSEALHTAAQQLNAEIIPLYCFDSRQFGQTSFGFPKTGAFRAQFLLESVANLRENLRSLGSNLIIREGLPEEVIPQLSQALNVEAVYYHQEVTSEELKVESALQANLQQINIELKSFWDRLSITLMNCHFRSKIYQNYLLTFARL